MRYDKLVRDKIPDIIRAKGGNPVTHTATDAEYAAKLKDKFNEELWEYLQDESLSEMADVFEVITAILELKGWTIEQVVAEQQKKRAENGAFKDRIVLEEA
jgi:predicted house-cleaning noncanonical NTP pyrophosphatase (MazG superfamily)